MIIAIATILTTLISIQLFPPLIKHSKLKKDFCNETNC